MRRPSSSLSAWVAAAGQSYESICPAARAYRLALTATQRGPRPTSIRDMREPRYVAAREAFRAWVSGRQPARPVVLRQAQLNLT